MSISALAQKNLALNPVAQDLGLGDQINQELQNELELRKKKLMGQQQSGMSPQTLSGIASSDLFQITNTSLGI